MRPGLPSPALRVGTLVTRPKYRVREVDAKTTNAPTDGPAHPAHQPAASNDNREALGPIFSSCCKGLQGCAEKWISCTLSVRNQRAGTFPASDRLLSSTPFPRTAAVAVVRQVCAAAAQPCNTAIRRTLGANREDCMNHDHGPETSRFPKTTRPIRGCTGDRPRGKNGVSPTE